MNECVYPLWHVSLCIHTLVDDEAFFRQVSSGDAAPISSQQEQDFRWIVPDGLHTGLVAQVQRSHLTGHSAHTHIKHKVWAGTSTNWQIFEKRKRSNVKGQHISTKSVCRVCVVGSQSGTHRDTANFTPFFSAELLKLCQATGVSGVNCPF